MSEIPDLSTISDEDRRKLALLVHDMSDFDLPELKHWRYEPCANHKTVDENPLCRECGIIPRKHQRVGAVWAFLEPKAFNGDVTGSGKTICTALLLSLMKEAGELENPKNKVLIIVGAGLPQWEKQLNRMLPGLKVLVPSKVKSKRIHDILNTEYDIVLTTYQTFNNDLETYRTKQPYAVIIDDVSPVGSESTRTRHAINEICRKAKRVYETNASPIGKSLMSLYFMLEPLGGREIFGSPVHFEHEHILYRFDDVYEPRLETTVKKRVPVGIKNVELLQEKIRPKVLRRTADDLDDVDMPELVPNPIYFDLYPAQQKLYRELQQGAIEILKESGDKALITKANNIYLQGSKICESLATLGMEDAKNTSIKFDFLEYVMTDGQLSDEKVIIYMQFKDGIRAMQKRMDRRGVGHVVIWGEEPNKDVRQRTVDAFWDDPEIKILFGTASLERSWNLHVARHMILVDSIPNPQRATQAGGRVKRLGSKYNTTYLHTLLTNNTQESRYMERLERESAVADVVLGDQSELFGVHLTAQEKLRLVAG